MRTQLFVTGLLFFGVLSCASAQDAPQVRRVVTSVETMAVFFDAIAQKDIDHVIRLTAPVEGYPPDAIREFYEHIASRPGLKTIISHLELCETAVVVFNDNPNIVQLDLDPAYLVRRDGKWLVLFKLTQFDRPCIKLTDTEKDQFQRLAKWYEEQKPGLKKLLIGSSK